MANSGMHLHGLPEELLRQIFSKIPTRAVLVGRAVCKAWKNWLSTPSFIAEHNAISPQETWIMCRFRLWLSLFTVDGSIKLKDRGVPANLPTAKWVLCESSQGLFCFISHNGNRLLICNPVTNAHREIPAEKGQFWKFTCFRETGEWKVLMVDDEVAQVHVFSSRTGSWKPGSTLEVDGRVHLPYKCVGSSNPIPILFETEGNSVVTYDLEKDVWTELEGKLPEDQHFYGLFHCLGHGMISLLVDESRKGIAVFKYSLEEREWRLVSSSPLCTHPTLFVSDGVGNIWIWWSSACFILKYNLAFDKWTSYQGSDLVKYNRALDEGTSYQGSMLAPLTCCTFSFRRL